MIAEAAVNLIAATYTRILRTEVVDRKTVGDRARGRTNPPDRETLAYKTYAYTTNYPVLGRPTVIGAIERHINRTESTPKYTLIERPR